MGLVYDIFTDIIKLVKVAEIVYEGEVGVYFVNGRVVSKKIKWMEDDKDRLEKILKERSTLLAKQKETAKNNISFRLVTGKKQEELGVKSFKVWKSKEVAEFDRKKMYDKDLNPGMYWLIPFISNVKKYPSAEKVLNLGYVSLPTISNGNKLPNGEELPKDLHLCSLIVSCNLNYRLLNAYKAITQVDDYEGSLKNYALTVLSQIGRGRTYNDWIQKEPIEQLEKMVLEELRQTATDKWGLAISKFTITDHVVHKVNRTVHEGSNPIPLQIYNDEYPLRINNAG